MEIEHYKFLELTWDDKTLVSESEYVKIEKSKCRIYHRPYHTGFEFICVEEILNFSSYPNKTFDEFSEVNILFKGFAYYDGVRHLYFGVEKDSEDNGYFYYPDLGLLSNSLLELEKLESKYDLQK